MMRHCNACLVNPCICQSDDNPQMAMRVFYHEQWNELFVLHDTDGPYYEFECEVEGTRGWSYMSDLKDLTYVGEL